MPGELLRDMLRGRRMARKIEKRRLALFEARIDIGPAEKALVARLVRIGEEQKGPRSAEAGIGANGPFLRVKPTSPRDGLRRT